MFFSKMIKSVTIFVDISLNTFLEIITIFLHEAPFFQVWFIFGALFQKLSGMKINWKNLANLVFFVIYARP
jgi:hypothetical protein